MPTFDYSEIAEVTEELLDEFGFQAKLRKYTGGGTEREPLPEGHNDFDITIVDIEEWTKPSDADLTPVSFRRCLISTRGLTVPVENTDAIVMPNGNIHQVDDYLRLAPGDVLLLWEVKLVN